MENQTTKDRILEAAEEIMLENSFHSVGLKQILNTAKVPKGSFYHYFNSKEQFGVEMLKHYIAEASKVKRHMLLSKDNDVDPLKRLFAYLEGGVGFVQSAAGRFPCLALKLSSEVSDFSEPMREELAKGFEDWITIFQEVLDEAISKKLLPETFDSALEAEFIQDLWTGATHRAVITRSAEPVRYAADQIKSRISSMIM